VRPYKCSILAVDDEPLVLTTLEKTLANEFELLTAASAEEALQVLASRSVDLVLADQKLPGMSGVHLLAQVKKQSPHTVRLLMTGMARFEDAVEAINTGQVSRFLVKPWSRDDLLDLLRESSRSVLLEKSHDDLLEKLQRLNGELEERVAQRTRELQEANHELQQKNWMLEKLALTDPLTGLPNRRAMDRLSRTELRRRQRYPSSVALGLVDVDHFKSINERYLLPGGDHVLTELGKVLVGSVRTIDSVGRIGGEEFQIVAPETSEEGATILAERIRSTVEATPFVYSGEEIRITVSVGFAVAEADMAAEYDEMKHIAAQCLAEGKNTGRNRCVIRCVKARRSGIVEGAS
jgi:diguanylate cyclase (GGDEF)-like protein